MMQNSMPNAMFPKLFRPGAIGGLELKNRIIKAPMVTGFATPGGCVTERMIRHYKEAARGGAGLIIVENTHVDNRASKSSLCQLSVSTDEHRAGLGWLSFTIKSNGAKACLQLGHAGLQRFVTVPPYKAPSPLPKGPGMPVPEELTVKEIEELNDAFGTAALRAKDAFFDMVEIAGCHGYLVTNFLSPRTNKRGDQYGGSLKNRMRFLLDTIDSIFDKVGKDFPLTVRLSGTDYEDGGVSIDETKLVAKSLERKGIAAIHVSGGSHTTSHISHAPMYGALATNVWAAQEIRNVVDIPIIASGSITTPQMAENILAEDKADFISFGRPLIADPYFPVKAESGRPEDICSCIRCLDGCVVRGVAVGSIACSVNPAVGREEDLRMTRAAQIKKVAVIGGGPAGMEAAHVAALRGHRVTLFEKRELGGVLIEASTPEFKKDLRSLIDYLSNQVKKSGVEIIKQEATIKIIKDGRFDAVIVATGAMTSAHDWESHPLVVDALDVFKGVKTGNPVIVVGGGMIGCDIALFLAEQGKKVTITTRGEEVARGLNHTERLAYFERLFKQDVTVLTGAHLEEVTDRGVVIHDKEAIKKELKGENVVLCAGLKPNLKLFDELSMIKGLRVYAIGDSVAPRSVFDAVHEGHWTAFNLL